MKGSWIEGECHMERKVGALLRLEV